MKPIAPFLNVQIVIVILIIAAVGAFFWFQNGSELANTFTVTSGPFTQEVSLSGRVVAVDDVSLGFVGGGRVEDVYVQVGDRVQRGKVLAEVENDTIRALILQRRAALSAEEANLAILKEGTRPEEIALAEVAVINAEVSVRQSKQALVEEIQDAFRAADNAVRVQADQYISNPRTSPQFAFNTSNTQAKVAAENQRAALEIVLNAWEPKVFGLTVDGAIDTAFTDAQANLAQVAVFLSHANAAISQGIPTGSVSSVTLESYASDTATARTAINAAITALTSAETAKKNTLATLQTAEKNLILKKAGATPATIRAQEAKVEVARASVLDAEAQLQKTFITAPFDGVVTNVDARVGESVAPNTPLIAVISDDALQVESFVPEINVARIQPGNGAVVTLDAYDESVLFLARIASVDPAETVRDGVSTYRAIIEFLEGDERIKAGMTATVTVTTAEKENVIAIPRALVRNENGRSLVRVQTVSGIEDRAVTTGLVSSRGTIEIISGLAVGDVVVP